MTMRASAYDTREDTKDEMLDIARNGKFMLQVTQYAADELYRLANNTVVKFAEKQRRKNTNGK
jgi:hypothetical protein